MNPIIYGTMIKVIAGFYLGCVGNISGEDFYVDTYEVELTCEYTSPNGTKVTASERTKLNKEKFEVVSTPRK